MTDWIDTLDDLGPEKIVHVYDPATGMKGIVVIDSTVLGGISGGGLRMMPDITSDEIRLLARAMTYKFCSVDFMMGGSKSGIWADPGISGDQRAQVFRSFGRAVAPLLQSGLYLGADIGTNMHDIAAIYEGAGVPFNLTGVSMEEKDGEPMENHATGYGVVVAARAACEFAGIDIAGASVAVEGFGKAGGGVVRYLHGAGAKVVAISSIEGTLYDPQGLDVPGLLESRGTMGDSALQAYAKQKLLPREDLFTLPVDVLVPGARPYVIDEGNADSVKARVIASIANIPITDAAENMLHRHGIHVVPDFISNAGGVTIAVVDILNGTSDDLFRVLERVIHEATTDVLHAARRAGVAPRTLAIARAREKIAAIRAKPTPPSFEEVLEAARRRFGL